MKVEVGVNLRLSFQFDEKNISDVVEGLNALEKEGITGDLDKKLYEIFKNQGIEELLKEVSKMMTIEVLKEDGLNELLENDFAEDTRAALEEMTVEVK